MGCKSLESLVMESEEISETIKELMLEEKRRNFVSRTDKFYESDHLRRCHSASLGERKR